MGLAHSPSIISDGLVFYLDAANSRSYSGTGTTINNLCISGLGAILVAGISFTSSNSGTFILNGTSQYINIPSSGFGISTESFTFNLFVKATNKSSTNFLSFLSNRQLTSPFNGVLITQDFNSDRSAYLRYQINSAIGVSQYNSGTLPFISGSFNMITMVVNRSNNTMISYLNGSLDASYNIAGTTSVGSTHNIEIGRDEAFVPNSNAWMGGNVGMFQIYNRALSATEILQNYNATRKRFGL
jgi:hypothetical protein